MVLDDLRSEIRSLLSRHMAHRFPRGGPESEAFDDAAMSLADYDGYLVGLVHRYLYNRPLEVEAIELPEKLEHALEREHGGDDVAPFRTSWRELVQLAELLSRATNVPIRRVST